MKFFWGDYFRDTRRLNRLEHSAYLLLLGEMWVQGGKLPMDDAILARCAVCTPEEWAEVKPTVLGFFKIARGTLTQKRVTEEMAKYGDTVRKRKLAGKAGGKAGGKSGSNVTDGKDEGNPQANAKQNPTKPEPEPEPIREEYILSPNSDEPPLLALVEKPGAKLKPGSYPPAFEEAWKAYPHVKGRSSKPKALAEWSKLAPPVRGALPAAIAAFLPAVPKACGDKGAPCMARWLHDGKHEAWLAADAGPDDQAPRPVFAGPGELRARLLSLSSPEFVANYIDPAGWDGQTRTIIARTKFGAQKIGDEFRRYLTERQIRVSTAGALPAPATSEGVAA